MYTTYTDSPITPEKSDITNILYTSIPSYVTSDHVSSFFSRKSLAYHVHVVVVSFFFG